jgi:hypothetical protein
MTSEWDKWQHTGEKIDQGITCSSRNVGVYSTQTQ